MKQKLFLGVSQQLKLTPQLQQAIKLLQLSSLELQTEIQEALYDNPLLEVDESVPEPEPQSSATATTLEQDAANEQKSQDIETEFTSVRKNTSAAQDIEREHEDVSEQSLRDYLLWQLRLSHIGKRDMLVAETIVDSLDEDGFLSQPMDDIIDAIPSELQVDLDECVAMLHRIQHLDPPGVGARDIQESLNIQLDLLADETPYLNVAKKIVASYLALVRKGDLASLIKQTRCAESDVRGAMDLLRSLAPRPGASHGGQSAEYIVPDVIVVRNGGDWSVTLNPETLPKLRLANQYTEYVSKTEGDEKQYIKDKVQEARWFLKSLESRHDTLLKVATAIVESQIDFFEKGLQHMRPLILKDLAEHLGFHESTISRATNQKYLSCPSGVFELKYFFSSQVSTAEGGEASSTAIKAMIQELVDAENPQKPLSDSKLTQLLNDKGIMVARRTVAKYREMLGIESSSARKRL